MITNYNILRLSIIAILLKLIDIHFQKDYSDIRQPHRGK